LLRSVVLASSSSGSNVNNNGTRPQQSLAGLIYAAASHVELID
jgi:hypothetical protein